MNMQVTPNSYTFGPTQDNERKELEEDYKAQGWTVQEIPATDGSGNITVILSPPSA